MRLNCKFTSCERGCVLDTAYIIVFGKKVFGALMDLTEQAQLIGKIKETFEKHIGEKVHVEQDLGRSRISTNNGIVYQVHPRLFILEVQRKRVPKARMSFQFADILTGVVKVSQNGEPLFDNYQDLLAVKKEPYDESEFADNDIEDELIIK